MIKPLTLRLLGTTLVLVFLAGLAPMPKPAGPNLAHMVFFTLKDNSKEARDRFVASCEENLTRHQGTVSFSVGVRAEDVEEPVSVKDFDVALHVVFADKSARDQYLAHSRHKKFVDDNKDNFAKVRVFDSYLVPAK